MTCGAMAAWVIGGLIVFWIGVVTLFTDTDSSGWWFIAAAALWMGAWWIAVRTGKE